MEKDSFNIKCHSCGATLKADASTEGMTVKCEQCNKLVHIPIRGISIIPDMKIGGFTTVKRLGVGGMGEVWLAKQASMERLVALKILSPEYTDNKEFVDRFIAEVKYSARLNHPNIVTAFDAGVDNKIHYLAISYIEGTQLEDMLFQKHTIEEKDALRYIKDIVVALNYAWEELQLLHRDIKPGNIMVDKNGNAKLMDMGISKSLKDNLSLTQTDVIMGTPFYMSPEQALDHKIDFHIDMYALGATLYHLLTGEVPYDDRTPAGVIQKHVKAPLPDATAFNKAVSLEATNLIQGMMEKNPEDRFATWADVIEEIDLILSGNKVRETKKQSNFMLLIIIILIIFIVAICAYFLVQQKSQKDIMKSKQESYDQIEAVYQLKFKKEKKNGL